MISVILCTFNRAERLTRCLDAFASASSSAPFPWELVVVDNASTDDTPRLIDERRSRGDLPLTSVHETKQGLSRARNAGLTAARHPIVAFTDDDCLVAPDWLAAIAEAFADPRLDVLGGRVTLHDEGDHPIAIRPFEATVDVDDDDAIGRYLIGCNMAVRRTVFDRVGLFDPRLGAGTRVRSAEDLDFFHRCLRRGMRLRYSTNVHVRHAHGRRAPGDVAALATGYLEGRGAFYSKHLLRGDLGIARQCYWEIRSHLRARRSNEGPRIRPLLALMTGAFRYILPG